jgi:hypothetical protein
MNTQEHLERIKQKCQELIAKYPPCESTAGWRATIAAIDDARRYPAVNQCLIAEIIAAWPEDLL